MEVLLEAIRNDYARPTVHARNLFHTTVLMWDAWSAYDSVSTPFMLGQSIGSFSCPCTEAISVPDDIKGAREETMSYAVYRLLRHRFAKSPGAPVSFALMDSLMTALAYDPSFDNRDYLNGVPAALGNYLADCMISFGWQDGANEQNNYANVYYEPVNKPLIVMQPGFQIMEDIPYAPEMADPNRWQPLMLNVYCDQAGNCDTTENIVIPHLCPEWGHVVPFALQPEDMSVYYRNDIQEYKVYYDPGDPPYLDTATFRGSTPDFKWTHRLVALWSAHLDPRDNVLIDISPGAMGNLSLDDLPSHFSDHPAFYDEREGGTIGNGHPINPFTGEPYKPNPVKRGDYTRVLSEFWADGPHSETPPGHWFTILNNVSDHSAFERRIGGNGPVLDVLEWDVKAYFALGGAMHDAAIAAWSIKGWYDYVRPISALREMVSYGQSTDPSQNNFHPRGIPLIPGLIDVITEDDDGPLRGYYNQHVGKIKFRTWRGPQYVADPATQVAGVDWIRGENWWPYQLETFVTPPFSGYISGHSTYSRAAAEVLTLLTGSMYFPGGLGEFYFPKNGYLKVEAGPSEDITLQWATYQDASDQTSLSRIWGGIHPPADDIPGRIIGAKIGVQAYRHAERYYLGEVPSGAQPGPLR